MTRTQWIVYDGDVVTKNDQFEHNMKTVIENIGGVIVKSITYYGGYMYIRCIIDEQINVTLCDNQVQLFLRA